MYYTYVLKELNKNHYYVGCTSNLNRRLEEHSEGKNRSTKGRSWVLQYYFAFRDKDVAEKFEGYLKTGSGRSFSKKHFGSKRDEA